MHDCRTQGGHFFTYKDQSFAFRCRRCNERFASSDTSRRLRQPWRCLIERCEYVACDLCAEILVEELALSDSSSDAPVQGLAIQEIKPSPEEHEERTGPTGGPRRGARGSYETGEYMAALKSMPAPMAVVDGVHKAREVPRDGSKSLKIEVDDDDDDEPYEIPVYTRTARQAAAHAAVRRSQGKVRHTAK